MPGRIRPLDTTSFADLSQMANINDVVINSISVDSIEAYLAPARPIERQVLPRRHSPLSREALREYVEHHFYRDHLGSGSSHQYPPGTIVETPCVKFTYSDGSYTVISTLHGGNTTVHRSYMGAAAHFKVLAVIEYRGQNFQESARGSGVRYNIGSGIARLFEFPDSRTHLRCRYEETQSDGSRRRRWFRTAEALEAWVGHRMENPHRARAEQFDEANHVDWASAAQVGVRGNYNNSRGLSTFDAVYISKGKTKRRQLKSTYSRQALEEFQKLAKKYHYILVTLLRGTPSGTWEECYSQGELECAE